MLIETPPLLSEVEAALKLLRNGKSPGMDNLLAVMIKTLGDLGKKAMLSLCQRSGKPVQWPEEWRQ